MAGGEDRLSELPDDLLRRVLHFTPLKEAASTTALSRRWRAPLWLSSGAMNLETGDGYGNPRSFTQRDAFLSAAAGSLDAAAVPVTRLTLHLESDLDELVNAGGGSMAAWHSDTGGSVVSRYTDLVHGVLSHRAARRVEELRIVAKDPDDIYSLLFGDRVGVYTVAHASLPLETLRILELTNCKGLLSRRQQDAAAVVMPRMSSLRMSGCKQHLGSLQSVIDAAPVLATVCLKSVCIDATDDEDKGATTTACYLRCPTATVLVLDGCRWKEKNNDQDHAKKTNDVHLVEIDAPRLRRFRYKGPLRSLSISPQPSELEQVDLDFSGRHGESGKNKDDPDCCYDKAITFWRFARSFSSTKEMMRLRVNHLEDIAVVLTEARRAELLPAFRRLQRLQVQGRHYSTKGKDAAMAILNILRCCPVLSALRINLLTAEAEHHDVSNKNGLRTTRIPQKEIQIAALAPCHSLKCLQNTLRTVSLQFRLEKSDCLGVKLIKFFAENAKVLKEMHIDGGDATNLWEQMNPKVQKWNSKRRKSGETAFVVLPLSIKRRR